MQKYEFSNYYNQESISGLDFVFRKARLGKYLVTLKEIINLKETMIDLEWLKLTYRKQSHHFKYRYGIPPNGGRGVWES